MTIHVDVYAKLHEREARKSANDLATMFDQAGSVAGQRFATKMERSLAAASPKIQRAFHGMEDAADGVVAAERKLSAEMQKTNRETERTRELSEKLAAARRREADAHRAAGQAVRDSLRDMEKMDSVADNVNASLKTLGTNAFLVSRGMATIAAPAAIGFLIETAQVAVTASQALLALPAAATAAAAGMGTLKLATQGFSDAMGDIRDVEKFGESLTKLSPNARSAALSIRSLLPEFDALQQATQNDFSAGFGAKITQLSATFLPEIRNLTTGIAQTMNQTLIGVADTLMTSGNRAQISNIMDNIGVAFQKAAPAAQQFVNALIDLTSVGSEFLPELGSGIADAATEFATFIREVRASGELREWIREGIDAAKELGGAIMDIGEFIYDVFGSTSKAEIEAWRNSINNALTLLGPLLKTLNASMQVFNTHIGESEISLIKLLTPLQSIADLVNSIRWFFDPNYRAQESALGDATDKLNEARAAQGLPPVNAQGVPTGPAPRFNRDGTPITPGPGLGNTATIPSLLGGARGRVENRPKPPDPNAVPFFSPELWQNISSEEFNRIHGVSPGLSAGPGGAQLPGAGPGSFVVDQQKVADAQTRLEAEQSDLQSNRLRLLELEAQGDATQRELLDAKRAITEDETALNKAQRELADAQQGTWKKLENQANDFASGMKQLGVTLDADFGLSKGLAGLAENLVAFVGNLAAAPLLGPLAAISQAQGGIERTGSGLIGMLAGQGAFGYQYTPEGLAAADLAGGVVQGPGSLGNLASGMTAIPGVSGGMPYGLPSGSNSGGYGGGGVDFPGWVDQMAAVFGIKPSTYPGHQAGTEHEGEAGYAPNPQGLNRGIDWTGPVENLQRFADYLSGMPQNLEQVIWQNPNTAQKTGIAGGQINPGYYPQGEYNEHGGGGNNIHVHTRQSTSLPVPGGGANWGAGNMPYGPGGALPANLTSADSGAFSSFGTPGSPQAIANMVYQQAVSRGYSQHEATSIVAYAIGESGLRPGVSGGAQGGAGAGNEVIGLFQQKPAFATAGGISPSQRADPVANTTAYLNNLEANRHLPIEQALPATSVGGPLASGPGAQPQDWQNLMAQASAYLGFAKGGAVPAILHRGEHVLNRSDVSAMGGQKAVYGFRNALHYDKGGGVPFPEQPPAPFPPAPGPFGPRTEEVIKSAVPGLGGAAGGLPGGPPPGIGGAADEIGKQGPSPIGGGEPKSVPGGSAGAGGGLFGAAAGAAAMAADVMAPGSGAAVQIAAQEIQRAIKFGSQVAGIAAQGLLDTFIPFGGSDLASNNWITRIGGAFAGMAPQLPNLAGKSHSADTMQQANAAPVILPPAISSGQGSGPAPGPVINNNITYTNNGAGNDPGVRDMTDHLGRQYQNMPGMQR